MKIATARKVINQRHTDLQDEIAKEVKKSNTTTREVLLNNPFLAGQMYAIGFLVLELNAIECDEQIARELRRASRGRV